MLLSYNVVLRQEILNYVVLTTEAASDHTVFRYRHKEVLLLFRYLDVRGTVVRFQEDVRHLTLLRNVQTGFEAHPLPYPMGTAGDFTGGKAAEV
jgi:hypothetical protein